MQKVETVAIVNAEIHKVWEDYINPEHIKGWAFASDDWECPHAENDLRVNGRFLTRMQAKDGSFGFDLTGTYREVVNLKKIVYVMDKAPEEEVGRECIVTVEDLGDNTTKVIVAFDPENSNPIEMQRAGWQSILDNFKKFVENN